MFLAKLFCALCGANKESHRYMDIFKDENFPSNDAAYLKNEILLHPSQSKNEARREQR